MLFRDLLLGALTYPDQTPDLALRSAVALAKRLGGQLTLAAVQVIIPRLGDPLANLLLDADNLARIQEAQSAAAARIVQGWTALAAAEADISMAAEPLSARFDDQGQALCEVARTRDLCLLPIGPSVPANRGLAEAVLFGSGRPIMVYPADEEVTPRARFETAAIAWDGGPRAARAVADALPVLRAAGSVRVLIATGEKPQVTEASADELVRHLKAHGVETLVDQSSAAGTPIGEILTDYVAVQRVDLLVMGGFGHARLREFVLGGATDSVLETPPCPVLMSH